MHTSARALREKLDPLIRKTSPLSHKIKKKATWVEPTVEAEVEFSGVTEDGILREAVYKGLREDLEVPRVRAEPCRGGQTRHPTRRPGPFTSNCVRHDVRVPEAAGRSARRDAAGPEDRFDYSTLIFAA